jgi:hypothetical protein
MVLLSPAARQSDHRDRDLHMDSIIALVTDDVYSVMTDRETLGYVHKVGTVYVALSGDILSHAVEVGQSLSWERAIQMVRFA